MSDDAAASAAKALSEAEDKMRTESFHSLDCSTPDMAASVEQVTHTQFMVKTSCMSAGSERGV